MAGAATSAGSSRASLARAMAACARGGGQAFGGFQDQAFGGRVGQAAQGVGRHQPGRQAQRDRAFLLGGVGHRALQHGGRAHGRQQQQRGRQGGGGEFGQAARADRLGGRNH